ncbi:uncharacterized protein LOC108439995 isoform X4 [Pygocentrus nattereri]|uniref:uncharacterized protein LOC108439995 isoform X4 n=1 Tax=Pygocentrus nattereri TaxID=42514 RepID=UPI001890FBCA|nr:uncharacterized protein LOC108439995 isoform X4 [Pygocentrus nattereri]
MRPLSVLLCAVTITCFCYCASSEDFTVTQTPSELTVKEGGSVSVACCWDKNITGVKVKWFKDDQLTGHWSDERLHSEIQGNCSVLSIKNIRNNETGLYICEVTRDVPKLDIRRGEGTAVKIQAENASESAQSPTTQTPALTSTQASSPELPVVVLSVSGALALIFLCVSLAVWRTCRKTERVVIREGPPSEGDEPEVSEEDDSSRNSRGSTQWYMVPVYESYFDLQRNDEESKEEQPPKGEESAKEDESEKDEESVKRQSVKRQSAKRSIKSIKRGWSKKSNGPEKQ